MKYTYHNDPKFSDTQKICCNHSKIWTMCLYHRVMSPNDADGMANSVDPDQTAPVGAVWSGSALFAQAYLSENLGSLRYRKTSKNLDIRNNCCNYPKIGTVSFYYRVMGPVDADGMANSVWSGCSSSLHCLNRPSVWKLRIITVNSHPS